MPSRPPRAISTNGKRNSRALVPSWPKPAASKSALRTERDKLYQQVATLKAPHARAGGRNQRRQEPAAPAARQERLTNAKLAARVAALRLKVAEAKLAEEPSLAEVRELSQHVLEAHVQVSRGCSSRCRVRYREVAELQQRDLKQAAATQANRARQADDPLERYRAGARPISSSWRPGSSRTNRPWRLALTPHWRQQQLLADRAQADFAEIKQLLADGNVSRLDALRLNNDFRRIGPGARPPAA